MARATTLIQNVGATDVRWDGIFTVGWQQSTAQANVTISIPLTYINVLSVPPSQVPAFLVTSIGSGSTPADQVASTVVSVTPQLNSDLTNYVVFSGLDLSAGSYYLVVNTEIAQGAAWDGYLPAKDSTTLSTAPGITYLGAFYDTGSSPQFHPSDPFASLTSYPPGSGGSAPGSLSFIITSSTSLVPEPQSVVFVITGLVFLVFLNRNLGLTRANRAR